MTEVIRLGALQNAEICGVISDRRCLANDFADENDIWTEVVPLLKDDQSELLNLLRGMKPDVVVTTIHKVLSSVIVEAFRGSLINLHYSLLPAFGGVIGAAPINSALNYGVNFLGTTVHFVEKEVDTGKPIVQTVIPTQLEDFTTTPIGTIFRCGCISLLNGIQLVRPDQPSEGHSGASVFCDISGRSVMINPTASPRWLHFDEIFWKKIEEYS
jgi:phosphoribosylglycinamide formyltransferase-1